MPSLLEIVFAEVFLADNGGKQMYIQQVIPRNKSVKGERSNYYADISKLATEGESLVQTSDH